MSGPPAPSDIRLVIQDYTKSEVRVARLDAVDAGTAKGQFEEIVGGQVIVVNGPCLEAMSRTGVVSQLGQLTPSTYGSGKVIVSPDLSKWIYAVIDANQTSHIHLGSHSADTVIADLPSPDGNASWAPFVWNSSGIYFMKQPSGLGGAGPFLDYHFELAKFDQTAGGVAFVSPTCIAYQVLNDGTMLCRSSTSAGSIEVRSPTGQSHLIHMTIGTAGTDAAYIRVGTSADGKRVIVARNGATDPVINYQIAVADLTSSNSSSFGPLDYQPDAWLPDGRVVAEHQCVYGQWGGGPCDQSLDGTYIFSSDGSTHTLFFKLANGATVTGYV